MLLKKLKMKLPYEPAIPLLGTYLEKSNPLWWPKSNPLQLYCGSDKYIQGIQSDGQECLKNYGRRFMTLCRRQWSKPSPRKRNTKRQTSVSPQGSLIRDFSPTPKIMMFKSVPYPFFSLQILKEVSLTVFRENVFIICSVQVLVHSGKFP